MKRQNHIENVILNKSRELIHAFMNHRILPFTDLLHEDFVWVGDYTSQYIKGRDEFLKTIEAEVTLPPFKITQEEYSLLTHERMTWITYGRFTATTQDQGGAWLSSRIHFTLVWKQEKEKLSLLHANACHVLDEPEILIHKSQARVFDKTTIETSSYEKIKKICIKDIEGNVHFLFPEEIIYIKSNDKLCSVHTKYGIFTARTTLRKQECPELLRIHSRYLLNIRYLKEICRYQATLTNGTQLPIGKERYKKIQAIIAKK